MTNDTRKPVPPREIRVLLYETRDAQPAATVLIEQRRSPIDPSLGASEMEPLDRLLACRALVGAEFDAFAAEVIGEGVRAFGKVTTDPERVRALVADNVELRGAHIRTAQTLAAIATRRDEYGDALDDALTALDALADGVKAERNRHEPWCPACGEPSRRDATLDELLASVEGIAARLREARGQR